MYMKNKMASILYKLSIAVIGVIGLCSGDHHWGVLRFFTTLSNLVAVIYFAIAAVWLLRQHESETRTFCPCIKDMVLLSLALTMLVAHFLLGTSTSSFGLTILHVVLPLMAIFDWVLFDPKGQIRRLWPIWWMAEPYAYLLYAMVGAQFGNSFGESRYPYPFLDTDLYGWSAVILTIVVISGMLVGLGYLWFAVDWGLGRKSGAQKERGVEKTNNKEPIQNK